jgi:hypothetical protein
MSGLVSLSKRLVACYGQKTIAAIWLSSMLHICWYKTVAAPVYNSTAPSIARSKENHGPLSVTITYPSSRSDFAVGMSIRIKASVVGEDEQVSQVQFFAETNLIAVVPNAPYSVWWPVEAAGRSAPYLRSLTAVAMGKSGISSTSAPVTIAVLGGPSPFVVYEITSPTNSQIFLPPATFTVSAEMVAGVNSLVGPTVLYVGTNRVGTLVGPPYSIVVTNLATGDYSLTVKIDRTDFQGQLSTRIRVSDLAIFPLSITEDGRAAFDVLTAYPQRETLIQASTNLQDWISLSTNVPSTNVFNFIDLDTTNYFQRFYRVLLNP